MKTRLEIEKIELDNKILKNINFRNSQSYIKDKRNYFYSYSIFKKNIILNYIVAVFSSIVVILCIFYLMGILLKINYGGYFKVFLLIMITIFGIYFFMQKIFTLLIIPFYYLLSLNKRIYYKIPYTKLENSTFFFEEDFIITKK